MIRSLRSIALVVMLAACARNAPASETPPTSAPVEIARPVSPDIDAWINASTLPVINAGFADAEQGTCLETRWSENVIFDDGEGTHSLTH